MNPSPPRALLRSLIVSYVLSGILLLLLSLALYKLQLGESQVNLAVFGVYAVVCLAGGFLAGKAMKTRRFFWGLLAGLLYFAVLFIVSVIFAHGAVPELSGSLHALACCAIGGALGGMFS